MESFGSFSWRVRFYWLLVVTAGGLCSLASVAGCNAGYADDVRLLFLVALAVAISGFKIRLPGVFGTLSMNYVMILVALLELKPPAGVVVALTSTLAQCVIHARTRPRWYHVLFSVAGVPVPVLTASMVLHMATLNRVDPTGAVALLAAAMVYFGVNTVTVAGIISLTTGDSLRHTWASSFLWTFPQYLVGGILAGGIHILNRHFGDIGILVACPPLYLLYRSYTTYLGRIQEQQDHIKDMAALHLRTIETLALAIDAKDDTTAAHLRRVQIYAEKIGTELRLSSEEMQALNAAALLHDVGKLAVPEYIISKPGKLTPEEFEKMKVHPIVGAEILERVNFPYPVVPIVRCHHEKYDGTGYPEGLAGEQIPIGARILAAVDCLDALASDRQYRKALPLEEAMRMVAAESGKSFDPKVVEVLQRRHRELENQVRQEAVECTRLSTNLKIDRGAAPAAGFADSKDAGPLARPRTDFSTSIASARREIQMLTEMINDLGNSLSLDDTLALLAVRLEKAVRYDSIAVYLLEDDKLAPRFVKGESYRLFSALRIPIGQGLSGWVAENRTPIVNGNPAVEPGYLKHERMVTSLRSGIAVPLISETGLVGVLSLYSLSADAFSTDDKRLLLALAPKAAHAIENSLRFEHAAQAADRDELTGLGNARSLFSHLERKVAGCSRTGGSFGVIVMDLDGFKQANDLYGHLAGNRILQAVGSELKRNSRAGDLVARMGGDEFVVVVEGPTEDLNEYTRAVSQISERLRSHGACDVAITISAGAAVFPLDGSDVERLLGCADERMYAAKRRKKIAMAA
jgi:diguanylate cyclase (GGDEF)-like protein/putative nucleotidyltransferase with HDIG domain